MKFFNFFAQINYILIEDHLSTTLLNTDVQKTTHKFQSVVFRYSSIRLEGMEDEQILILRKRVSYLSNLSSAT